MKRILILLCLLPAVVLAQGPIDVSWVNATHYSDCTDAACDNGTPMPGTAITSALMQYGTCIGSGTTLTFGTQIGSVTVQGGTQHAVSPTVPAGIYCARVSSFVGTTQGELSNPVQVTIPTAQLLPGPPTNLQPVVTTTTAYDYIKTPNAFALLPVGTVPLGTLCDGQQGLWKAGQMYFVVPLSKVTITASIQPQTVVAICQ